MDLLPPPDHMNMNAVAVPSVNQMHQQMHQQQQQLQQQQQPTTSVAPAVAAIPPPVENADILCRGCNSPLYTKVQSDAGKSWRCDACWQLFTVKSSAKRHVSNSHKDPVCRQCQGVSPPPTMVPGVNGGGYPKSALSGADGSSGDQDDDDQDEEMELEPELALLTLMLKNHLDLKGVDNVLELLNGGMDFSGIQNASHWLQRLGKHAAVQYTTSNCPNCKRTEVQIKVDQNSGAASSLEGLSTQSVTLLPSGRTETLQMSQQPGHQGNMGTVLGVFDPSSGQIITASHVNLDKNMLQKMGQMNGVTAIRTSGPPNFHAPTIAAPAAPAATPRKAKQHKSPVASHPAGSVNTSWKAVARTYLHSLHTKDELLRLCVVGRRMDRTSALGLQPMDAGKRKIVGDAVAEHCTRAGIPTPPDTLLNHFMSQILCDSRRKEQLMVCGGELQRRPKKIKVEMQE
ncbi:hypothetical protein BV898_07559 [Hypsibius exemplaris]|uniref:C2H2-type domain-containing protein n=1 Tax=Hypsibius exemplaris TaxID=2072580 RepID=A0A1W0WT32_HYPEX|nr:hypothetical protein BV898_07559 [Hypsibius exemplaris]